MVSWFDGAPGGPTPLISAPLVHNRVSSWVFFEFSFSMHGFEIRVFRSPRWILSANGLHLPYLVIPPGARSPHSRALQKQGTPASRCLLWEIAIGEAICSTLLKSTPLAWQAKQEVAASSLSLGSRGVERMLRNALTSLHRRDVQHQTLWSPVRSVCL